MSEFDWLEDEKPEPKKALARATGKPKALLAAERKLTLEQRIYARIYSEASTTLQANKMFRLLGHEVSTQTLKKWRDKKAFMDFVLEYKTHLLHTIGFSKEKVILDAERVRESAMTPKPITYKGDVVRIYNEDTEEWEVLREINGGVAMRAIEFQGKSLGIGDSADRQVVVNLDVDFSGPKKEAIEGELVDE